jgi:hypothetical protein
MTPGPRTATYMATADDGVRRPPTVSNATDDDGVGRPMMMTASDDR